MVEPTGWYRFFWRDEKNIHQNGWKGEIKGNQITTWFEPPVEVPELSSEQELANLGDMFVAELGGNSDAVKIKE